MPQIPIAALLLLAVLGPATAQTTAGGKTILDGVYSEAQAARGQNAYTNLCAGCHGAALEGVSAPELTGNRFTDRWREGTLDGIYSFIKQRMPPARSANAKPIPDRDYLDILTYVLKLNNYPVGPNALTSDGLGSVMFVGKNGSQPVPDGALVITVGCLAQGPHGGWVLSKAADPARTRSELSAPVEIKSASQKSLGNLTFRLAELDAVPDFAPEMHSGHKMLAKGYLVRQPNAERISISSLDMVAADCR